MLTTDQTTPSAPFHGRLRYDAGSSPSPHTVRELDREKSDLLAEIERLRQRVHDLESHGGKSAAVTTLDAVIEAAPNAVVQVDQQGCVTACNGKVQDLLGYSAHELVGEPIEILVPAPIRPGHPDLRTRYFADPSARWLRGNDLHAIHKNGSEVPVEIGLSPIETPGGLQALAAIVDISERKRDVKRMHEQQEVLLHLALSPGLLDADLGLALHEITEAAAHSLGVERSSVWTYDDDPSTLRCLDLYEVTNQLHSDGVQLCGQDFPSYFRALARERVIAAHDAHRDPRTREFSESYLTPLGISSMLDAPIRVGGEMIGVVCHEHVGTRRSWTEEEQSFAASLGDLVTLAITAHQRRSDAEARRRLESKVQQAQKLESLGVLAGGIAHDFNNLLVGILGNAGLALEELSPVSGARECIVDIETAAKRAADLCQQLLAYSGKGKFVIGPINLNEMMREMGHLLEVSVSKKALLKYELTPNLPPIEADATQIRQIIMNLITNASEALGGRGGVVAIRTGSLRCDRQYLDHTYLGEHLPEDTYVYFEVSDTGCGMTEETRQKIFDPFFTSKFAGRGLGLAAVQGIVRGHGGAIRIYTEFEKGTTFKVLFPRTEKSAGDDTEAVPASDKWRGSGTVMLVDDDEVVRTVGQRMLEKAGFDVVTAADGMVALELLAQQGNEVVCVVLDLTMPRLSGEDTFREIRKLWPDLPVILSSGYNEQEAVSGFVGKRLAGFVKKPYEPGQLIDKLREALGE